MDVELHILLILDQSVAVLTIILGNSDFIFSILANDITGWFIFTNPPSAYTISAVFFPFI